MFMEIRLFAIYKPFIQISLCCLLLGFQLVSAQSFRVLHYTQTTGYDHGTADESLQLFRELEAIYGFEVDHDTDGSSFSSLATLQTYDVIVWSNTSGSFNLSLGQRQNFESYMRSGGSYLGIHAASDTYRHSTANGGDTGIWDFYAEICGGSVQNNPNHTAAGLNANMTKTGPFSSTKFLPDPWNKNEEYYYWENGYLHPDIQEVLRVEQTGNESYDVARPIAWQRELIWGGRSFYTALGHNSNDYIADNNFKNHIRDGLLWVVNMDNPQVAVQGELKKWHKVTISLDGPTANEDATVNPFMDYRMTVLFQQGNTRHLVPGYFAADGNSAESSAETGNKWQAHFRPDGEGLWNYTIFFRYGTDVAINPDSAAGIPTIYDGLNGSFIVGANDKTGDDFRAKGRLAYAGEHYLQFTETEEFFIKSGSNGPENFLGYFEFDNTTDNGGNGSSLNTDETFISQGITYTYNEDGMHHYEPHVADWQAGDPQWQGTKGRGIIGAVNYLASEEVNFLYLLSMNVEGDGREVYPWTEYWMRDRYDVSKLAQWEIVFDHMEAKGIGIHLVLQEQENDQLLDAGFLDRHRRLYFRELIARFGHHLALMWNLGEENTNTKEQRRNFAKYFTDFDPYGNPVSVHTFIGQQEDIYGDIEGIEDFDVASVQMDLNQIPAEIRKWVQRSDDAGRKWFVTSDEIGPFDVGVSPDGANNNHADIRNYALYGTLFNGGGGTEWYFGYDREHSDLDCEDFRSRDLMWDYTRFAREFLENYLTYPVMRPAPELLNNPNAHCFAIDPFSYAIYLLEGNTTDLNLGDFNGTLQVQWYNPRTGGALVTGDTPSITGPGFQAIGNPPAGSPGDWVALIGEDTPQPLNTSPGFSLSGNISVDEDFTTTEVVTVTPDPVPPNEAGQVVTYSLSPATSSFANISINPATGEVSITAIPGASGTATYTVIADDGQSYNNTATQSFTLEVIPLIPPVAAIRINTGGPEYVANDGNTFVADQYFSGGSTYTSQNAVGNTQDETLYQTERTSGGPLSYNIPIENGEHTVRLHFAEIYHTQAGSRVMIINIEDSVVLTDFDIFVDAGGANQAIIQTYVATVNDNSLDIVLSASVNQPKISAIEIIPDATPVNNPPTFSLSTDELIGLEDFAGTMGITVTPDPVPPSETSQIVSYTLNPATVPFANIGIDGASGEITVSSIPDLSGSQTFTITADDGQATDSIATQTFTLTINPVNDAPIFTTSGDIVVEEDFVGVESLTVTPGFIPADELGQVVSYSLIPASIPFANVSFDPATGQVDFTAIPDGFGTQIFTITADDGQATNFLASQTFEFTVNAINTPPTFTISGDVTVDEDFPTTELVTVIPDAVTQREAGQTVVYSLDPVSVSFANVSIDAATGEVTITSIPDASGTQVFTITADDGQSINNLASQTFTLTVNPINDAPTFSLSGDIVVEEDFVGNELVTVSPDPVPADETGQTVTYSLSPATVTFAFIAFNTQTGQVTISSLPNETGTQEFTLTADDGQANNNQHSQTFNLTVTASNTPPDFNISGDVNVDEEFLGTETVTVFPVTPPAGEAGQTVSYSLSPANVAFANVSIDPATGEVSITSIPDGTGSQLFTITADDGQALNNLASQTFTLNVNPVNDPPAFTVSGDINVVEEFVTTETVTVSPGNVPSDEQGQQVTYSLAPPTTNFVNVSLNPTTGQVDFTAIPNGAGSQTFTLTADDGQSENNTAQQTFTVTVTGANDPPTFAISGDVTVDEEFGTTEQVTVTPDPVGPDEITQTVTYSLVPSSVIFANVSIDPATGVVDITAVPDGTGSQTFTIAANDGQATNNVASQTFTLTVNPINDAPTFTTSGDISVAEDFAGTESLTVSPDPVPFDESLQPLSYSLSPATVTFANVSLNTTTGQVDFTAIADSNGTQQFTLTASDGQSVNNTATQNFTFTVGPVNDPPTFSVSGDITVEENFTTTETVTVSPGAIPPNEIDQIVSYSLSPAVIPFANIAFDPSTGQVDITAVQDGVGTQVFTITANDGQSENNLATGIFTLIVEPVNSPPSFTLSGDLNLDENFVGVETVTVTPDPVAPGEEGQVVTYSLSPSTVNFANISFDPTTGEVSVTARPDYFGSQVFTITADDGQLLNHTYSQDFTLTVTQTQNTAPTFTLSGDVNVVEDFVTTEVVSLTPDPVPVDEQDQTVTYTISPTSVSFANIDFDPATGNTNITFVPDANGSQIFTITANDGAAINPTASQSFTLTVSPFNDAPTFGNSGNVSAVEDFVGPLFVDVTAAPPPADEAGQLVLYSLNPNTVPFADISINPATGQVTINSVPDRTGSQTIEIIANDGQQENNEFRSSFELTITPENDPPVFTVSGDVELDEDFQTTEIVTVTPGTIPPGEEGQVVTYSLSPASVGFANVVIDPATGNVSITAVENGIGSQIFTITGNDGQATNAVHSETFTLTVNPVNDAPSFSMSGDVVENQNFQGMITVSVVPDPVPADELSQTVSYSISPAIVSFANIQFDPQTGQVTIQSVPSAFGSQVFTITANDGQSMNNLATATFSLTINEIDEVPGFSLPGDLTLEEDFTGPVDYALVPDSGLTLSTISYEIAPTTIDFASLNFNPNNGAIQFNSVQDANGSQVFTLTASNGDTTVVDSFLFTVTAVNDSPAFTITDLLNLPEDFEDSVVVSIIPLNPPVDEQGQEVTYSIEPNDPDFISVRIDQENDFLIVKSLPNAVGSQVFRIIANDGQEQHQLYEQNITITVNGVDDPPTFTLNKNTVELEEDFVKPDTIFLFPDPVSPDEANQVVSYILEPDSLSFVNLDFNPLTGWLIIHPIPDSNGVATLTLTGDDGFTPNRFYSEPILISVDPVNDPPNFRLDRDSIISEPNFGIVEFVRAIKDTVPLDERDQVVKYSLQPEAVSFANVILDTLTGNIEILSIPDSSGSQLFYVFADDGQLENSVAVDSFFLQIGTPTPFSLRINAGASADMAFGTYLFVADTFFTGGKATYNARVTDVLRSDWDELYRSGRSCEEESTYFKYEIPVKNGDYVVYLHFAEMEFGAFGGVCCGEIGKRVFQVSLEGTVRNANFDILKEVGPMSALLKPYQVQVRDSILTLEFDGLIGHPALQAIEILTPEEAALTIANVPNPNLQFVDPLYDFTSADSIGREHVLLYPNPTQDHLSILMENDYKDEVRMEIFDSFGRFYKDFVFTKDEVWATYLLNLEDLIPGSYAVRITIGTYSFTRKFWKVP